MAASKKHAGRGGDGVKFLGVRDGERWWEARLTWTDSRTGEKHDTTATFKANSKLLAMQERAKRLKQAKERLEGLRRKRFDEVADEWFETIDSHGTRLSWGSHLNRIRKKFGSWWIDAITTRDLQSFLGGLKRLDGKPLGKSTFNSVRDVIIKVFVFAQEKGYVESAAVARATLRRKSVRTREEALAEAQGKGDGKRALTDEEAVKVLTDLAKHEPDIYPLVVVMFILGCRFAEASAIRRDCLDLSTGIVHIAWGQVRGRVGPTKGKRRRKAALGPVGLRVVQEHLRRMDELKWPGHEELVFPRKPEPQAIGRKISDHWPHRTVARALRESFTRLGLDMANATHAARHTMNNLASQEIARAHLSESLLRKVVGHSTAQVAATYRHPEHAEVIQLAEVVEKRLFGGRDAKSSRRKGK